MRCVNAAAAKERARTAEEEQLQFEERLAKVKQATTGAAMEITKFEFYIRFKCKYAVFSIFVRAD